MQNWDAPVLRYEQSDYKIAFQDVENSIQLDPNYPESHYLRALIRNELGNYAGSIEDYNHALKLNSDDVWFSISVTAYVSIIYLLYTDRGDARANLGDYQGAIEDYNKVFEIECSPQFSNDVYDQRGNARYKLGDLEGAIEDYNKLIFYYPKEAVYYINRGNVYSDLKNHQKAIEDYSNAINIIQTYPDVYEYRGLTRYHLGDKLGAIEDLNKAAALYQQGGWIEYYQHALNLIQSLDATDEETTNEDTQEIPETINHRPIELENTEKSVTIKPITNPPFEYTGKNKRRQNLEKINYNHLPEIKELTATIETDSFFLPKSIKQAKERISISITRRQGQPQFRQSLLEVYNYRCAITGCDAQAALEAAHIIPYNEIENNHPSNGLLLRADIHTLFDLNLIAINPETMQVHIAPSLRDTTYGEIDGKYLQLPKISAYSPNKDALKWRCNQCEWYN
ncbi:hypothetical protein CDG76_35345 [Nostoc sp. 'Peltigera membranacea cyanobiont' 210A]|nr:hypothetical protein CDG76_35345 [Nostoc sp. 'Peltigera membranacea cyanobiont' 210A]